MKKYLPWLPNGIAALILLQTLFFKFSGHPQSVELFTEIGLFGFPESIGRIGTGIAELIVSVLLFKKRTELYGALGVIGIMIGALFFHFTILGFEGENLNLAVLAVIAMVAAGAVAKKVAKRNDGHLF